MSYDFCHYKSETWSDLRGLICRDRSGGGWALTFTQGYTPGSVSAAERSNRLAPLLAENLTVRTRQRLFLIPSRMVAVTAEMVTMCQPRVPSDPQ